MECWANLGECWLWDGAGMGVVVFLLEVKLGWLLGMNAGCLGILLVEMGGDEVLNYCYPLR